MNSNIEDSYLTIEKKSQGEYKEKGSKFISFAFPFDNIDQLKLYLDEVKSIHPKARHYCYAYKMGSTGEVFRVNDDGEPSGSAGRPILNVILSKNITNCLIIVVRYFGGTLLGVPGLINAYKSASLEAISNGEIAKKYVFDTFTFEYTFEKTNDIMRIVKEFNLQILSQSFNEKCELTVQSRQSISNHILERIESLRDIEVKIKD